MCRTRRRFTRRSSAFEARLYGAMSPEAEDAPVHPSLPVSLFSGLDQPNGDSRFVGLAQRFGVLVGRAEERISIGTASPSIAEALSISPGSAIAVLDRVVCSIDGQPLEWRMAWCQLEE